MALRERSNSTSNSLVSWFRESFGIKDQKVEKPKQKPTLQHRATSTPLRNVSLNIDMSLDLSAISELPLDFAALGAFGSSKVFDHPDFDNDIANYCFHMQAISPNTATEWAGFGGEHMYRKVALYITDIYMMKTLPREILHLAFYYLHSTVKDARIQQKDLEDLALAAVNLACKIERQLGLRMDYFDEIHLPNVHKMEQLICKTVRFNLWPTTIPFFMRLVNSHTCVDSWQWPSAKCLSDLMTCDLELCSLPPALAAGVAMRLICGFDTRSRWSADCYAILQHPKEDYDRPHALLCRLVLRFLDEPKSFEPLSSKHQRVIQVIFRKRRDYLQDELDISQFHRHV